MVSDISKFSQARILVVGDVMLDQYVWGDVERISPEAPVPVVKIENKTHVLGGAGNVTANLSELGCQVTLVSICGEDEAGETIESILTENSIKSMLFNDKQRPTITKTRVMAQKQQLFRLDNEETSGVSKDLSNKIIKKIESEIKNFDVIILSDYNKGLLKSNDISKKIISLSKKNSIPVIVDPKGKNWTIYKDATCITPNINELSIVSESEIKIDKKTLVSEIKENCKKNGFESMLLTMGADGMCLVEKSLNPYLIETKAREVFDVSGAGDTVIATFSAGIASGFSYKDSAEIANIAAGIVVGKIGTKPVTKRELEVELKKNRVLDNSGKIINFEAVENKIEKWKNNNEVIVFTNGCFDLLHPGHIDLLKKAKESGDRLIIGLNSDESVKRIKGPNRPIITEKDRASILSSLTSVDLVIIFNEDTPEELLKISKPDILIKGSDYIKGKVVGQEFVESYGGIVKFIPILKEYSFTQLADKMVTANKK